VSDVVPLEETLSAVRRRRDPRASFALALLLWPFSCGGGDPPEAPSPVGGPSSLILTPSQVILPERGTSAVSATVLDPTGQPVEVPVVWGSSDARVVMVADTGGVLAVQAGSALVWARAASLVETVPVTVVPPLSVEISYRLLPPDSVNATASATPGSCVYRLTASVAGGAPGDSATWAASAIDALDDAGSPVTVEVTATDMLDRFGTLVMRSGDELQSTPLRIAASSASGIVNRVRYTVGAETRSVRIPVACEPDTEDPAPSGIG